MKSKESDAEINWDHKHIPGFRHELETMIRKQTVKNWIDGIPMAPLDPYTSDDNDSDDPEIVQEGLEP